MSRFPELVVTQPEGAPRAAPHDQVTFTVHALGVFVRSSLAVFLRTMHERGIDSREALADLLADDAETCAFVDSLVVAGLRVVGRKVPTQ